MTALSRHVRRIPLLRTPPPPAIVPAEVEIVFSSTLRVYDGGAGQPGAACAPGPLPQEPVALCSLVEAVDAATRIQAARGSAASIHAWLCAHGFVWIPGSNGRWRRDVSVAPTRPAG